MTVYNETMNDGALLDGVAIVYQISQEIGLDGTLIDGADLVSVVSNEIFQDGAVLDGIGLNSVVSNEIAQDGALLNGDALSTLDSVDSMNGGVLLNSTSSVFEEFKITGQDGVEIDGSYNGTVSFNVDLFLNYSINNQIDVDASFYWSVGELPLYWWQIEGYVWPPDDTRCLSIEVPERQNFIQTILARNPKEVCEYFARQNRNWQIVNVKRFTQPADAYLADQTDTCNALVPINVLCPQFLVSTRGFTAMGMTVKAVQLFNIYQGGGTVNVYGEASAAITSGGTTPTTSSFEYVSTGLVVTTGGSATSTSSFAHDYISYAGIKTSLDEQFLFGLGEAISIVAPDNTIATSCGTCVAFPLNLYIEDNIENPSILANFLRRNAFELPSVTKVSYSKRTSSWTTSLHYTGISTDNIANELWRIQYEWGCTSEYNGETGAYPLLKFSILITKKNLDTNLSLDTRILVYLPSDSVCNLVRNFAQDLIFQLNVHTGYVSNVGGILADSVLITDNIGIFKSAYWVYYPNLSIRISGADTTTNVGMVDLYPIFPIQSMLTVEGVGGITVSDTID